MSDIAMDSSNRQYDKDGRLHILRSHISKESVNPYYGREIPRCTELGLDPQKIYYLYRSGAELEKGASSFARLPVLSKHIPINTETIPTELIVGTIGTDVKFAAPYLDSDLCFWTAEAIAGIETEEVQELSCAYHYVPVMTSGEFDGQRYDGIMTEIVGNHLCLLEAGRAGPDVMAADSKLEIVNMKMTSLGKALHASLGALYPKLAQDSKFAPLVANLTKKTFDKPKFRTALLAMDAELPMEQADNIIDALTDVDQSPVPAAVDSTMNDGADKKSKLTQMLTGKVDPELMAQILGVACDAEEESGDAKKKREEKERKEKEDGEKKIETAMDGLRRDLKETDEARRLVRPVVGDVIAQDSAADIYKFALDKMGASHEGVDSVPALKAMFNLAASKEDKSAASLPAMDTASLATTFPNAIRFKLG